ncbi:ABC transporter substrate-binding protein [Paenibacillus campi]|uniref:ABC transporter substrate-binding protein n=1 Tax=Paenibacillus campi TaxID=3106031 RepID=UPI002B002537|nr:ABC transporter substrate-binding protein [Paenibacillus sp. SGZ-1014]
MMQYLQLYERLNPSNEANGTCAVTIAQLAELLCCTPRNVKLILRRLEAHGWIAWQPGRGRGNHSHLQFVCSNGALLEQRIHYLLERDKVKEALDLVSNFEGEESMRERLSQRIHIYLGLHQEQEASSRHDVLRMIRYRPLGKLDTVRAFSAFEIFLMRHIFDTLVAYDSETERFVPKLAHLWECSEDRTAWTFYLRKGVRFHDGKLFTARDVAATLERIKRRGDNIGWLYRDMESIRLHDDYALTFTLKQQNTMFLHLISNINMAIVPEHEQGDMTINGTGPFRVSQLNTSKMSLSAFDGYYGYRPLLDRVDVWFLAEEGGSNRYYRLTHEADGEEQEQANSRQLTQPALGGRYLLFNMRVSGVQHDVNFRYAMRLLYDRQTMQEELQGDRTSPAGSFLPWKSAQQTFPRISLDEAKRQLALSSYHGEMLMLSFTDKKEDRLEAEWIQRRAAAIGLKLELAPQEDRELLGGHIALAVEVLEDDWEWDLINFFSNEVNHLHRLLDTEQLRVLHTMLYDVMRHEQPERERILEQMERKLQQEHWLLLGNHINQRAYFNRSLSGLHLDSFGFPNLSTMWIRDKLSLTTTRHQT